MKTTTVQQRKALVWWTESIIVDKKYAQNITNEFFINKDFKFLTDKEIALIYVKISTEGL